MAIDTADKRGSAGSLLGLEVLPTPDGTVGDADRLQTAGLYSGISAADVIVYVSMGHIFVFTLSNWSPLPTWYIETTMRATSGTARARLYDLTDAAEVADSAITTASATHARVRSAAIALTDAHEYEAQFGTTAGDSGEARGADLIGVV